MIPEGHEANKVSPNIALIDYSQRCPAVHWKGKVQGSVEAMMKRLSRNNKEMKSDRTFRGLIISFEQKYKDFIV
jgi:hypothetical protein